MRRTINHNRQQPWPRLESRLYIPPMLSRREKGPLLNPRMMDRGMGHRCCPETVVEPVEPFECDETLCIDAVASTQMEVRLEGIVNGNPNHCPDCDDFNTTYILLHPITVFAECRIWPDTTRRCRWNIRPFKPPTPGICCDDKLCLALGRTTFYGPAQLYWTLFLGTAQGCSEHQGALWFKLYPDDTPLDCLDINEVEIPFHSYNASGDQCNHFSSSAFISSL